MKTIRSKDRELWNEDIAWLLLSADKELGGRSGLGSTVATLERGGAQSGSTDVEHYTDRQIGWCVGESSPAKWRRLIVVWREISHEHQGILIAHYRTRNDMTDQHRTAVDGEMGKLANASWSLLEAEQLAKLIEACVDKGKEGRKGTVRAAYDKVERQVREAHRAWDMYREVLRQPGPKGRKEARAERVRAFVEAIL